VRVPENAGVGSAKVTVSFDAWKEGEVASTRHDVSILLPKSVKLATVSPGLIRELIHPNKSTTLHGIRFTADGKRVIAGDYPGGIVALWDVETGKRMTTIETGYGYRGSADYFFITPDWKTLYVASEGKRNYEKVEKDGKPEIHWQYDGSIRSWNLDTGALLRTFRHNPPRYISSMRLSGDGSKFVTSEWLPGIRDDDAFASSLWDANTGKFINLGRIETYGRFAPDGKSLVGTTRDKDGYSASLVFLDAVTGKPKQSIPVTDKSTRAHITDFSPNAKWMLVGYQTFDKAKGYRYWQYRLDVLESATGKKVASLVGDPDDHLYASFSPDSQTIAANNSRTKERKLRIFSVPENRVVRTISLGTAPEGELILAAIDPIFSPDGKHLALATQMFPDTREDLDALDVPQPRVLLFDVKSGALRETLVLPQGFSRAACFSPDGRTLAIGGHGRILLWDVTDNAAKERRGPP
jgi:WD40 repeat protein